LLPSLLEERRTAMRSEMTLVQAENSNQIGIITLNNPKKRNCLSSALIGEICQALASMQKEESGIQNFMNSGGMLLCKEMLFTSQPLGAHRLIDRGIVNHAVPREQLEATTMAIARQIAQNSPQAISLLKEELRLLSASHNLSPETFERVQAMRREVYDSEDYQEGIHAFHEKRAPEFHGR
jgi:enoyl-CoA hydratase/carnithine racemase